MRSSSGWNSSRTLALALANRLVAADGHHRAVDGVLHRHSLGLDVVSEEARQAWPFDHPRLHRRAVDGLHRDLADGVDALEHRLGVGGQLHPQAEQQGQQQGQADGDTDPAAGIAKGDRASR